MQRHKKWLIITIWISTIAFVGAGFVGWGQYSYGDKAGAVAKVGNIEISMGELQKSYSRMYAQYNQMFQGNFDEEKAKQFGLKRQALQQLTQQALILNLANDYDLEISDAELLAELKTQKFFFKDGVFNKEIYKQVLSRNNLTMKEYEDDLKKSLLIQKTIKLLPVQASQNEKQIINTIMSIADKINYKVLSPKDITLDTSDAALKPFWEKNKNSYLTEVSYDVNFIKQDILSKTYDDAKIASYYADNKTHFKDADGKILPLERAKDAVIAELNAKATKDTALRSYIAFKKAKLNSDVKVSKATFSASKNPYNAEVLEKVSKASLVSPFIKPILVNGVYYIFELTKVNPAVTQTFEQAKAKVLPSYVATVSNQKLQELAQNSVATFNGTTTDFITSAQIANITQLSATEAKEFLSKLFTSTQKRSFITLNSGKVVLYNILEQKLLPNIKIDQNNPIVRLKSAMFNEGLIKTLQNKYQTEIFIEGL
jgi:peptidyl-prolyl cis-trans isomerase D